MKLPYLAVAACLVLGSCSSEPPKPKEPEKPAEPVTGSHALQKMYLTARSWAPDLQIASMTSLHFDQVKDEPGKAGGWQVTFVSPSQQKSRVYTWAAEEISMAIHKGVGSDQPSSWSGGKSFLIGAVKVDSDEAYKTAVTKVAKYAEAHPGMRITYQLQMGQSGSDPAWRIIWGENAATSADSVLVSAVTGEYMGTLH